MADDIVHSPEFVTLVGAGQAGKAELRLALKLAPRAVAADGGAKMLLNCGKRPEKIIGDLDSTDRATLEKIPVSDRLHVAEQESTDFEKCLARIRAPLIIGVGFLGRRLDHQLAVFNALVRHRGAPCVLLGARDVVVHGRVPLALDLAPGMRLSLFPMARLRGESQGLQWPIAGIDFAPDGRIGTSNRVVSAPVRLGFDGPGMLIILPRKALGAVVRALAGESGRAAAG